LPRTVDAGTELRAPDPLKSQGTEGNRLWRRVSADVSCGILKSDTTNASLIQPVAGLEGPNPTAPSDAKRHKVNVCFPFCSHGDHLMEQNNVSAVQVATESSSVRADGVGTDESLRLFGSEGRTMIVHSAAEIRASQETARGIGNVETVSGMPQRAQTQTAAGTDQLFRCSRR
jgi:hypothetical protein